MTDRTRPATQPPTPAAQPTSDSTAPGSPSNPSAGSAASANAPSPNPGGPFRLNLEQQKNRAKELLRAAKAGEPEALERIALARRDGHDTRAAAAGQAAGAARARRAVPGSATAPALKLAEAQFAIARELRFPSWAKLKAHIASMEGQRAAIERKQPAPDAEMKTLHLRCGHDIQNLLVEAGFVGSFHPHVAPYCQGPVTAGPERHELMARFIIAGFPEVLWEGNPLVYENVLAGGPREDEFLLRTAEDYERVVIWVEYDNWDQIMLARVLAHYADAKRPRALELVTVDEFPGGKRFLGLGELPPEALRLLWPTRKPITQAQLNLGRETWKAFTAPDPQALAAVARSGTPALPIMAPALLRQMRELPDVATGLGGLEKLILQILAEEGTLTLNKLFWTLLRREPLFFIADAGVARVVREMERAAEPPLVRTIDVPGERTFRNKLTLTDAGRAVLSGARDWHSLKPPPRWVGGVQVIPGAPGWRWDESKREPVWFGGA
jgi:hypothetical protein